VIKNKALMLIHEIGRLWLLIYRCWWDFPILDLLLARQGAPSPGGSSPFSIIELLECGQGHGRGCWHVSWLTTPALALSVTSVALAVRQRAAPSWTWAACIELGSEPARAIFFLSLFLVSNDLYRARASKRERNKLERTPEIDFNIFVSSQLD
jgi:hypothetical protein